MFRQALLALIIVTAAAAASAQTTVPATRPAIPPLVVGGEGPKSFLVTGIVRFSDRAGWAFHVATDGRRELCAVYDAADGTPILLSDGQQTLVYDLSNSRIVRVAPSRAYVRVDWLLDDEKPLKLSLGVQYRSSVEKLVEDNAWFRIDRFVEAAAPRQTGMLAGAKVFSARRPAGGVERVQAPDGGKWFRFTSAAATHGFDRLEMEATRFGQEIPEAKLAFPDLKRLPADLPVVDLEGQGLAVFLKVLANSTASLTKFALAGGPEGRTSAAKLMPNANWDELAERDRKLGAAYRQALAAQGLRLPVWVTAPATRPGG